MDRQKVKTLKIKGVSIDIELNIDVRRVALNMSQVEQYNPPPNPAKDTDSRFPNYQKEFGDECWELDALNPNVLVQLVRDHVDEYRDTTRWAERVQEESVGKDLLQQVSDRWEEVAEFLNREE